MLTDYYRDLADRATKTAAQAAVLSIGVESAQADALSFDWRLMLGMALGGAVLSLLTNVAERGIFGRRDEDGSIDPGSAAIGALVAAVVVYLILR